jgi:hypothetical protein
MDSSDNFSNYFNSRIAQELDANAQQGVSTKFQEVERAAQEKIASLEALHQRSLAVRRAQENSLVGRLGLDPNSTTGSIANTLVATGAEGADLLANTVALPLELAGSRKAAKTIRDTLNVDNQIAPRDDTWQRQSGLARRTVGDGAVALAKGVVGLGDMAIGVGDIATGGLSGKGWDMLGHDSKTTNKILDEFASPEMRLANQQVAEADGFLRTLEVALDNPSTIASGIIESLPAMLAGGKIGQELLAAYPKVAALVSKTPGLQALVSKAPAMSEAVAGALGEGTLMAGGQAEGFRQDNPDGLLSFKQALLSAGTGAMGAATSLAGNKLAHKLGVGDIDEALVHGSLQKSPRGYVTSTLLSGGIEAGEEALQSTGETILKNVGQDKPWDQGVGNAAAMGALTAFPMGAVGGLGERAKQDAKQARDRKEVVSVAEQALKSGDVSALLDPKGKAYSPSTAIGVLQKMSLAPDATEEQKAAAWEQASKVVSGLESERKSLSVQLDQMTPEGVKKQLAEWEQKVATTDMNDPVEAAKLQDRQAVVEDLKQTLASFEGADPKKLEATAKNYERQISAIDDHLSKAKTALDTFNVELNAKPVDLATEMAKVSAADPVATKSAVERIINLAMASPEKVDAATVDQLLSDSSLNISAPQRAYLRAFSQAQVEEHAAKGMAGVSQNIFVGNEGKPGQTRYWGINQYRTEIAAAIKKGDEETANALLEQMRLFHQDHASKAEEVGKAWDEFQTTRQPIQLVNNRNRAWVRHTGTPLTEADRAKQGAFVVRGDSQKVVQALPQEAKAIKAAYDELSAAVQMRFSPNQTTTSEANGSETPETKQAKEEGSQVPAADGQERAPVEQSIEEPAVSDAGQRSDVEANGLNQSEDGASGSSANPEVAEQVTNPGDVAMSEEDGMLSAVREKSPEGTPFKLRNLIAEYFTQSASREGDSTSRPLVKLANFLSHGMKDLLKFLPEQDQTLTAKQQEVLQVFQNAAKHWQGTFQKNLARRNQEFWYTDMMQYLIQDKGNKLSLEENVTTAMSYAAFSWIAENASKAQYNTPAEINAILDRDEDTPVSKKEEAILGRVGTRQNVVLASLGQRAIQALGLKVSKDAPRDLMPKLETAIGAHIMKMMLDEGILERNGVTGADMAALTGSTTTKENATFWFLRLAHDAEGKLNKQAERVYQTSRETRNVLDKLFSVEPGLKEPSLEPVPFTQKTTKNTRQLVPSKLAKIVEHENGVANYVRQDMWQLITQLGQDIALQMAGFVAPDENTHVVNRLSIQAKNDALVREYERFMDFVNGMADQEAALYFEHSVWKQQRVGIATNVINPQASKMHRFMLYRDSWTTKVDMNDLAQMDNFRLRVLEGLNVKTDKQANTKSLAAYDAKVNDPVIKNAVEVLRKSVFEGGITEAEQQTLLAGVKAGKLNFHSLDALMALAHEAQAKLEGKNGFTVQMMGEVDGVTNGPMLSHLLLGAADSVKSLFDRLNRGGFFQKDSPDSNYNVWRGQPGRQDLYEVTALHMTEAVRKALQSNPKVGTILNSIYEFTGDLGKDTEASAKARRNIVKTPLTALVFGSSTGSAVDSMADTFIEAIYAKIEAAAADGDVRDVLSHINVLLNAGGERGIKNITVEQLLKTEFNTKQTAALKKSFKDTLGKSVSEVLQSDFETFTNRRTALNKAAQLAFNLYNAAYTGLRDSFIAELVSKGEMEVNSKGEPVHDLTPAQDAELRKRLRGMTPIMHTLMSKESNSLASGLYASKSGRKLSDRPAYAGEIKFGTGISGSKVWSAKKGGYVSASSVDVSSFETTESDPGVAMVVMSVHSTDSAISHLAADGHQVLNIHDAHGSGLKDFTQTAENLNKATWHAMLNYSPAAELSAMLSRTVTGLGWLLNQEDTPAQVKDQVIKALKVYAEANDIEWQSAIPVILMDAKYTAHAADNLRLEALSQMQSIDQYALEGGNYEVQEADRQQAAEMRAQLSEGLDGKETNALQQIADVLDTVAEVTQPSEQQSLATVFGKTGEPSIKSDQGLVSFFEANPKAKASEVMALLAEPGRLAGVNRKILGLVSRTLAKVDGDLTVRYITPSTDVSTLLAPPTSAARGWYVATEGNKTEIYVLSPAFVNSGLTNETLLHELVHAAIARTIANPTGAAKELVSELEFLLAKAQEFVKANNLTGFDAALKDVQEFVAWGMTNEGFQQQVLNRISVPHKTGGNKLVTGMKKFIETLTALLFKPSEEINNGLQVLVSNVSGLMAASVENVSTNGSTLNMSQEHVAAIDKFTTQDIFEALDNGAVSSVFADHLGGLLSGIVNKLHGPFGAFADSMRKTEAGSALDTWVKALTTGNAPFASAIAASGFAASEQESFVMEQVEATVRAALDGNEASTTAIYKELTKLFAEAKTKLTPADFASQADYDFIFKLESNRGERSDYLSRFAALALANEKFNALLKFDTKIDSSPLFEGETFADKVLHAFQRILGLFQAKLAHVYGGQQADAKLTSLVSQLVDIEARKREALASSTTRVDWVAKAEDKVKEVATAGRDKVADLLNMPKVSQSKHAVVQSAGAVARVLVRGQTQQFFDNARKAYDRQVKTHDGLLGSMIGELRGPVELFEKMLRATKHLEALRKGLITQQAKLALGTFLNGKALDKEQKASVTYVFMRTGLHNLLDRFNLTQIEQLIGDKAATEKAISDLTLQLPAHLRDVYTEQVNALGFYKITELVRTKNLKFNAYSIARLVNTGLSSRVTEAQAKEAEPILAALVSLYALKYTDDKHQAAAKDVLRAENNRTDGGNGVEFVLKAHQQLEHEALEKIFNGNPMQMIHGYTPDILNPHIDHKTANEAEGKDLEAQGYEKGEQVTQDPSDPNKEIRHTYIRKGVGLTQWLSGATSMTGLQHKGTTVHNGFLNTVTQLGMDNAQMNAFILNDKTSPTRNNGNPARDLNNDKRNNLAPLTDENGEIVNWRYMMSARTKDAMLERNNSFDQVLGTLAGSVFDKDTSAQQNVQVIEAVREQYEMDYHTNPDAYVMVGSKSTDARLHEIWNLLPDATKAAVRKAWGRDGMMVRKDSVDLLFGYRKFSLNDMFQKDPAARKQAEQFFMHFIELLLQHRGYSATEIQNKMKRIGWYVARGERMWQAVVREVKDVIVVRTGVVTAGNIMANWTLLAAKGVPLRSIVHHHKVIIGSSMAYLRDTKRLADLESLVSLGQTQGKLSDMEQEIIQLKDAIDRNPAKKLVDAGLMPTIVEDAGANEDPYSYKSELTNLADKYMARVPQRLKDFGNSITISPDTVVYQGLSRAAQLSDFVARYTLYQHLTERNINPLSDAEAIQEASDAFVNYDIPMHKSLQWSDDMGFTMFTKYFLRMQRVLLKTARDNPLRVLMLVAMKNYFHALPVVTDSSFLHHLGNNPLRGGAFEAFKVWDELPLVSMAMQLVK